MVRTFVPDGGSRRGARLAVAIFTLGLALLGLAASSSPASAQTENELTSSEPADGDTLAVSPTEIVFTFGSEVGPDDLLTAPVSCANEAQDVSIPVRDDDDERIMRATVNRPFPRGACIISWSLADADGAGVASGIITFSVQSDPETTEPAGTTGSTTPAAASPDASVTQADDEDEGSTGGALWLGRVLSTTGILILFGAIVLISTAWPEGPEYVITVRFLRSMWALALIGTVLFVIAYTADFTGESFGSSISPGAWFDLTDAGWPGRAALARLVLVLATGWVVMRPERVIDPTTQLAAWGIPALAVLAVGLSRTGGDLALIGVVMGIAHAFGSAVWIGGAVLVARVVLAGPGDDDLVQAVRGFNRLSGPAILVTVGTGVVQLIRLDGGALFSSSHGQVLLLKTVAVAAMVFVAMTARQMVSARLDRVHEMTVPLADRFRRAFSAEAVLGLVVLGLSGWLLALTPENVDPPGTVDYVVDRQPFIDETSGLEVYVSVTPAEVGRNGLRVEVEEPPDGISNLVVSFIPPEGSGARGIEQPIPLTTAGTAVLDEDVGFPLDAPGTWTMQLSGVTSTGTLTGAVSTFAVTGDEDETESTDSTTTTTDGGTVITVIVDPELTTTTAGD